jgi:hypothetical protein
MYNVLATSSSRLAKDEFQALCSPGGDLFMLPTSFACSSRGYCPRSARAIHPRREVRSERRPASLDLESFGSAYIGYHHASQIVDGLGSQTFDSSLYTDLYSSLRLRLPSMLLRTQFSGGYRHQFATGDRCMT